MEQVATFFNEMRDPNNQVMGLTGINKFQEKIAKELNFQERSPFELVDQIQGLGKTGKNEVSARIIFETGGLKNASKSLPSNILDAAKQMSISLEIDEIKKNNFEKNIKPVYQSSKSTGPS